MTAKIGIFFGSSTGCTERVANMIKDEIEATGVPELLVLNKVDTAEPVSVRRLVNLHPEAVAVSALTGEGLEQLLERAGERLEKRTSLLHLAIPYGQAEVAAAAHRLGEVLAEKHDEHGTVLDVRMPLAHVDRFRPYVVA